ncbi:MAG: transcription antitermination factor NusB [Defluviitaleaceae bacterium]|nr:transcription antitermination factor NusB [Defluviitaleaceae bacterium]
MSRRDARRHAFHLIFQYPFFPQLNAEAVARTRLDYYSGLDTDEEALPRPKGRDAEYVDRAVWGVHDRLNEIDGVIENFLKDWDIERISRIDLAVMRLAIYEMLCEADVPLGAAVNEAVEIAKEYGADESPAFVNGVLGNVARAIGKDRK